MSNELLSEDIPPLGFFLNKLTGEVHIDFLGKVHASENMIPITPEQAAEIENKNLWGDDFDDDYDPFEHLDV